MNKPRTIILDFDGVIIESERGKFAWLKRVLKKQGIRLRQDDFTRMAGKKTAAFLKEQFSNKLTLQKINEIKNNWRNERLHSAKRYSQPIRGVLQFIKMLKKKGFALILATGTERTIVHKTLNRLGILREFDKLITGNECNLSKPNPKVYNLAIKAAGIPAKDILVIEDSAAGVLAAKRAGLRCVAITTTHKKHQLKFAYMVVRTFKELMNLLDKSS